ncbi:MAG: amidohydrolase family protein [Chloroflexi bacterium]|nr:amidohydrolase family protein [Chloroflexota bacterium]
MIIDVHTHIVPEHFPSGKGRASGGAWPSMEHGRSKPDTADVMIAGKNYRTVDDQCWSSVRRVSDIATQGIDRQVISPMPRLLDYAIDAQDGLDLARYLNETIAELVTGDPTHFYGLGSVPLQDVDLAARELESVKALGLHGVEITTHINGVSPGDPRFLPFWKEVERLSLSVFVHGQDPTFKERLVGPAYLENAIGFPMENALAAASVVTSGLMGKCPELRVCFSHGGGPFTMVLPRIQHLWHNNATLREAMKRPPAEYARMLYYDDVLFDDRALRYLIDTVGANQVVIGSDYPFMSRTQLPDQEFDALGLSDAERESIGWRNCLRFLGEAS